MTSYTKKPCVGEFVQQGRDNSSYKTIVKVGPAEALQYEKAGWLD